LKKEVVKALIVDDNADDALLVSRHLAQSPTLTFDTDQAVSYQEALSKILSNRYDVCLIDYCLDGKTGLDLIRAAIQMGSQAAMIIVTGHGEMDKEERAIESGAADYLIKGKYDADMLERVIRHTLYRTRVEREMRMAHDTLEKCVETRTSELCDAITALQKEMDQREIAEQQLREAEERYRIIFEQAMNAIVVIEPETGAFKEFNHHAFRQLGFSREDFKHTSLFDIDARETRDQIKEHIQGLLAHGAETFETLHRTRAGELRNILVSARPILLSGKKFLLAIFNDYTERKQMEDDLRSAVIRLEQHNKAKSEFVTNVSHELKTPLTSMMYGVRNLLKGIAGPLPDYAIKYLKLFDTECQRLVTTINDILDLGKLDNKTLTLSLITAPLRHLVFRCMETLRPQAESARITLQLSHNPSLPFVRCDANMIQRVIQNIIGNAIKFTPRDGSINVDITPDPEIARFARITVTDSGVGISPDALGHITERYFKANSHASGSGLGLAISKEIVMLHGGRLIINSPPPGQLKGTAVSISLPLADAPTVLVADDDPFVQTLMKHHLNSKGFKVISSQSGQETILMAESNRPDLILLDLVMEDIHGTTVILTLKGSHTIRYIPIIAVTGATLDEPTTDILTRFSIPTLSKPWNIGELMETIESALLGLTAFQTSQYKDTLS